MYEKLISDSSSSTDILNNVFLFLDDYNDFINDGITSESIIELCEKAEGKE